MEEFPTNIIEQINEFWPRLFKAIDEALIKSASGKTGNIILSIDLELRNCDEAMQALDEAKRYLGL